MEGSDIEYWNYRVLRRTHAEWEYYGIYEVYYNDKDEPIACTKEPVGPGGDSFEEAKLDLKHMERAFSKPVLNYGEIGSKPDNGG